MIVSHEALTGVWEDDGVYLVTAKSLAEGTGYRRIDLPGQPFQTKYPPLYPFLLSCIWRIAPGFPGNIVAMQIFNAACGTGAGFWRVGCCVGHGAFPLGWRLSHSVGHMRAFWVELTHTRCQSTCTHSCRWARWPVFICRPKLLRSAAFRTA